MAGKRFERNARTRGHDCSFAKRAKKPEEEDVYYRGHPLATEYRSSDMSAGEETNSPSGTINRRDIDRSSHPSAVTSRRPALASGTESLQALLASPAQPPSFDLLERERSRSCSLLRNVDLAESTEAGGCDKRSFPRREARSITTREGLKRTLTKREPRYTLGGRKVVQCLRRLTHLA